MLKLVIAAACLCATIAPAQSSDLSGPQISELLAGTTVEIDTPVGTKLPVRYTSDGKLFGEAGGLAWYLGAATDRGRWWVAGDQLCHKWLSWFNSEPQCLRLRKEGRVIRWRSQDGNSGTATIAMPASIEIAAAAPAAPPRTKEAAVPVPLPAPALAPDAPAIAPQSKAVASEPADRAASPAQQPAPVAKPAPVVPAPVLAGVATLPWQKQAAPPPKRDEPKHAAQLMFKVANVPNDDVLNVRSGPSADFEVVGELPPGSRGIAITSACQSQWCPVQHRAASGWVNSAYLTPEGPSAVASAMLDAPDAPRACLAAATRALLDRIEQKFGSVQVISTCRPGATISGTWRASRHASGHAVDFKAGSRKAAVIEWLIANHRSGGTMTYAGMDHIHVDIGPRFVSIANGPHWSSWQERKGDLAGTR